MSPAMIVEFTVKCSECGAELDADITDASQRNGWTTTVEASPCEKCMEAAEDTGYEKGHEAGGRGSV